MDMNLYSKSSLCRFIMTEIENGNSKEVIYDKNLTIEHIMPQTPTVEWSKHFSEKEYETYLHTLGNLTLTGYNSELSNKSFQEKKDIIRAYSKAVVLNHDVLDKNIWTIEDIKNRSKRLTKVLLDKYKIKKINDPEIEFEYTTKITLDDVKKAKNKKLISFTFKDRTYPQSVYAQMLVDVIKLLDGDNPNKLQELANNAFSFRKSKGGHVSHISNNPNLLLRPMQIRGDIFVEGNFSAKSILTFIKALLKEYEVDESKFHISVTKRDSEDSKNNDDHSLKMEE